MENQEIDKPFWINGLKTPDEKGNYAGNVYAGFDGKIKVSLGKPKQSDKTSPWKMEFKTVLPDHIHAKIFDQKIERIRDNFSKDPSKNDYTTLKKTITAYSLEKLVERYNEIIDDYLFLMEDEKAPRQKMIFVKWNSLFRKEHKSYFNGAKMGQSMGMDFNYFVGYFNGKTYFDIDFKIFNTHYDKDLLNYKMIPWTAEREEFFDKIYSNFETMRDKLDSFFSSLNDKTIESHMGSFKLLS